MKNSGGSVSKQGLVVLFLVLILVSCGAILIWFTSWDPFSSSINDPALLGINADFEVPESARNIEGYFEGLNNFSMYGKLDMDASDFEVFEANANCEMPFRPLNEIETRTRLNISSRFGWWQPSEQSLICTGRSDGCGKTLIVDISDPNVYTVYVDAGCG